MNNWNLTPSPKRRNRRRTAIAGGLALMTVAGVALSLTPPARSEATPHHSSAQMRPTLDAGKAVVAAGATAYIGRVNNGHAVGTVKVGVADRATRRKARTSDQFQIGSNTKTFVAVVALQLVREGNLSLDGTVEHYLPGVIPGGNQITVQMLLQQTSGLFDHLGDDGIEAAILGPDDYTFTDQELIDVSLKHEPVFAPGTSWGYSNTNFVLAGMIIEKVSGSSMAELIEERIAMPLNLKQTYLSTTSTFTGSHLHGYHRTEPGGTEYVDDTNKTLSWAGSAGAVISTLSELATFEQALQSGRLLQPAHFKAMRTTVPIPGQGNSASYGLGIAQLDTPCGVVWGHTGGTIGYLTQSWASDDGKRSFVQNVPTGESTLKGTDTSISSAASAGVLPGICAMFGKDVPTTE